MARWRSSRSELDRWKMPRVAGLRSSQQRPNTPTSEAIPTTSTSTSTTSGAAQRSPNVSHRQVARYRASVNIRVTTRIRRTGRRLVPLPAWVVGNPDLLAADLGREVAGCLAVGGGVHGRFSCTVGG